MDRRATLRSELSRISPRHSVLRALSRTASRYGDIAVLCQIAIKYPILVANELNNVMTSLDDTIAVDSSPDELAQLYFRIKAYLAPEIQQRLKATATEIVLRRARIVYEHGLRSKTIAFRDYTPGAPWNFELTFEKMVAFGERIPTYRSIVSPYRIKSKRSFILIVDKSHSVYRFMAQIAIAAAVLALALRKEAFAVLAFDSSTHFLKKFKTDQTAEHVVDELLVLESGGKTNLKRALETGLKQLRDSPPGTKRIACLLSDLQPTEGGDPLSIANQFEDLRVLLAPVTETQGISLPLTRKFERLNNTQVISFHRHSDIPSLIQDILYD